MTMKLKGDAIIMDARKHAVIQSIDFPEVNDETIVVKTKRSGVSFGTDMSLYEEQAFPASNLSYPLVPSYEEVGEVIFVGE